MNPTRKKIVVVVFSSLLLSSLVGFVVVRHILDNMIILEESDGWWVGNPEDFGFDLTNLQYAYDWANRRDYLRSVLIVRHGILVAEWYFNDGARDRAFHIHSSSKSVLSAIFGIAHEMGYIPDLDKKMMDYFPEYEYLNLDPWKYNITIRHLLQMKGGLEFDDSGASWLEYASSSDWVKYALELPKSHDAGEDWDYSTPQTNLLSVILTKATGMSTKQFADLYLFGPLGITIAQWSQDPQGYYTGGHEMYFTPRDMAKFGLLYLNNGTLNEEEIVSKDWVLESIQNYEYGNRIEDIFQYIETSSAGYGYQWWTATFYDHFCYMARGCCGQVIYCIPDFDLVVVTTACGTVMDDPIVFDQIAYIDRFLINYIFPAINDFWN